MPSLTIEEAALAGGFGSAVLEYAHDVSHNAAPIDRLGIPDHFIEHGNTSELLNEIGVTTENAVEKVVSLIRKKAIERENV